MAVKNSIADMHAEIIGWRRHLHENPELMFAVHETASFVVERLKEIGVDEITPGIGKTGVVAVIKGRQDSSGRVIGLRADMDALPIYEATGLDYRSKIDGKMHACGHDGHTAMLLGAAKYLSETRNFDGTAVLIFQPAEEGGGGGKEMCDDGMMDRWGIQEVYGLHNTPGIPVGQFAIRSGAILASADEFVITVTGVGGHAAAPHEAVDTTFVAAQIVVSLQSVVARNVNPLHRVVVTVGTFETDSQASNIIAQRVIIKGTVRALDSENRTLVKSRIRTISEDTASAFGATASMEWRNGYPPTINHEIETGYAADAARTVAGDINESVDPIMPAEDFAYMLEERPGAYIFLGNGDSAQCHHPAYDFNDEAIPAGSSWFAELIERRMALGERDLKEQN